MERKDQIVNVAQELIDTRGYGGFSYKDIETSLGIRKASIHHHFAKKEDLGLAVMDRVSSYLVEKDATARKSSLSAWEQLWTLVGPACDRASCSGKVCTLSALQHDFDYLPEAMQAKLQELCETELDLVAGIMERGRSNGQIKFEGSAKDMASNFLATVKGAMHYARVLGGDGMAAVESQWKSWLNS